jgi:hypothetical protein
LRTVRVRLDTPERVAVLGAVVFGLLAALVSVQLYHGELEPDVFRSPDEAINRLAALQVAEHNSPTIDLPFEDPEDLVHMRYWYSDGATARPAYPPLTYYVYGMALKLGALGALLPWILSVVGVGSLAAAGALLSRQRPRLGLLFPLLAFPFTYWVLRPWHNIGFAYAFIAVSVLLIALWANSRRAGYLAGATACVAVAGAARADLLLYIFAALWLVALAVDGAASWRRITLTLLVGGVASVGLFAALNWLVVGEPFRAGYQEYAAQGTIGFGDARDGLPFPLQELAYALAPWGISLNGSLAAMFAKYWVLLWPAALLVPVAALGYVQTLRDMRGLRIATLAIVTLGVVLIAFTVSRHCEACFGSAEARPTLDHSELRYFAAVYLLAAVAALRVARAQLSIPIARAVTGSLVVIAGLAALWISAHAWASYQLIDTEITKTERDMAELAEGTVVYGWFLDKRLWNEPSLIVAHVPRPFSVYRFEAFDEPAVEVAEEHYQRLASSMIRAYESGHPVAVLDLHAEHAAQLHLRLREQGFGLVPLWGIERGWLLREAVRASADGRPHSPVATSAHR